MFHVKLFQLYPHFVVEKIYNQYIEKNKKMFHGKHLNIDIEINKVKKI